MRKFIGFLLIAAGCVMLALCARLALHNETENRAAQQSAEQQVSALRGVIEEKTADAVQLPPVYQQEAEPAQPIRQEDAPFEAETVTLEGSRYIGILAMPTLGIELPVAAGWSETQLKTAPCRYYGSASTGDLVICGHNYTVIFGRIHRLRAGDPVYFTETDGTLHRYAVSGTETLEPDAVEAMISGDSALTLYTCTYGGQQRITVRCTEIK